MFFHFFRQVSGVLQARGVFLCSDDNARFGQGFKSFVDSALVATRERMMVAESQRFDVGSIGLQVVYHLLGRGNACEQQHMTVFQLVQGQLFVMIEGLERIVSERGEIEALEGEEIHSLDKDAEVDGRQRLGTLCDDDDVGAMLTAERLAQPSGRQQPVVDDEAVVVYQQDVDARTHVAVLEGIVEKHHVGVAGDRVVGEVVDAGTTVSVYSHVYVVELALHLEGLVANVTLGRVVVGQHIAMGLALVATREHRHLHMVFEQADEVFHVWGLARSAHSDIAYRDDGQVEAATTQQSELKKLVAEVHPKAIEPT